MNNTRRQQFQMPKASSIYAGLADPQGCRSFDQSGFAATLLSTTNLVKLVAINSHATTCLSRTISSKPKADWHFLPYHAQLHNSGHKWNPPPGHKTACQQTAVPLVQTNLSPQDISGKSMSLRAFRLLEADDVWMIHLFPRILNQCHME